MAREFAAMARYAAEFNGADAVLDAARTLAPEYGRRPLGLTTARAIEFLASALAPSAAVEVGTSTGAASLSLLRGMHRSGILTSIDTDPDAQAVTRELIAHAGLADHRVRMITGRGEDVLARLASRAYDLVLIDAEPTTTAKLVPLALERLEDGGVLVLVDALAGGDVAEPANRSRGAASLRRLLAELSERDDLRSVLLPVDSGLLVLRRDG